MYIFAHLVMYRNIACVTRKKMAENHDQRGCVHHTLCRKFAKCLETNKKQEKKHCFEKVLDIFLGKFSTHFRGAHYTQMCAIHTKQRYIV